MNGLTAIILGGGRGTRLYPLTRLRAKPAVPIAGKFRLIDIPISNCLHANVRKIFILTQFNTESLHRHIHNTYRFDAFSSGFVRILAAQQTSETQDWYQGTADAVRKNLQYFGHADDHIIVLSGDHLYRMNYLQFFQHHLDMDSDVTIAVKPIHAHEASQFGILKMNGESKITDFHEKPQDQNILNQYQIPNELFEHFKIEQKERTHVASMGIYIFRKDALIELLESSDKEDFGKQIIPDSLNQKKVYAYLFDGYWEDIGTMRSFFNAHMELTQPVPRFNFYDEYQPFYSNPRYLPATKIYNCQINQSLIAEGGILLGSIIEDSVVGIRSYINAGTFVQRSIIMGNTYYETIEERSTRREQTDASLGIGNNCIIRDSIIDLNAHIGNNVQLINKDNKQEAEGEHYSIRDGIIVIPKGAVIPDNTII
ncbi:MAG: glucose-1-phosphate adenylyltransferase [Caldithrix sp.]|nr:glucose-1-phosphate adenylyltransferase [Caldithrix sp.]